MTYFTQQLLSWYESNKRDLPWRSTRDPYFIWLSEVILQQTRVDQGLPYFNRLVSAYPTVFHLANAAEDELMKYWQGLGYYSRCRNLHNTAKIIVNECKGEFPSTYIHLLTLKGIGPYTAAAIASFAFDEDVAVVDGNVNRFLSRYFGVHEAVDSTVGKKLIQALATEHLPQGQACSYNNALMEMGAVCCTKHQPTCEKCPLADTCYAVKTNTISELPVKQQKLKRRTRYLLYYVFKSEEQVVMQKRAKGDIWEGLYDFPCVDVEKEPVEKDFVEGFQEICGEKMPQNVEFQVKGPIAHELSHQSLRAFFCEFKFIPTFQKPSSFVLLQNQEQKEVPIPKLIERYLNKN